MTLKTFKTVLSAAVLYSLVSILQLCLKKSSQYVLAVTSTYINQFQFVFAKRCKQGRREYQMFHCPTSSNECFWTTWQKRQTGKHKIVSCPSNAVLLVCQTSTSCYLISSMLLTRNSYSCRCITPKPRNQWGSSKCCWVVTAQRIIPKFCTTAVEPCCVHSASVQKDKTVIHNMFNI